MIILKVNLKILGEVKFVSNQPNFERGARHLFVATEVRVKVGVTMTTGEQMTNNQHDIKLDDILSSLWNQNMNGLTLRRLYSLKLQI